MKKVLLFLMALCLLLGCLAGCKKPQEPPKVTTGEAPVTQSPILADLPTKDFEGRDFTILVFGDKAVETDGSIVRREMGSDDLEMSIYRRTLFLEDQYNVNFKMAATQDAYQSLFADVDGGGQSFDLVMPHPTEGIAAILTSGLCTNLLGLNNLSLDQPWYVQSMVENYQTNGKLYTVVCDLDAAGMGFNGIIFNEDLYESVGYTEDLYELVYNGEWTLDHFYRTVMEYQPTNEGVSREDRMYSMIYHKGTERAFMYGAGQTTVKRNSENQYEFALKAESLNVVADYLYKLVYEAENIFVGEPTYYSDFANCKMIQVFKAGHAVFFEYDIGGLYLHLRDIPFNLGYLPMPKLDTYQDDYQMICGGVGTLIPAALNDKEDSAIILEAMARHSHLNLRPAFYNTILQGRLSPEPKDYEMLDYIFSHIFFDIGFTFDGAGTGKMKGILTYVVISDEKNTVDVFLESNSNYMQNIVNTINNIQ